MIADAANRRASYAAGPVPPILPPAPDIFGDPEQFKNEQEEERPSSRLGILPTPTRTSFGFPPSEPSSPTRDGDEMPAPKGSHAKALESQPQKIEASESNYIDARPLAKRQDTDKSSQGSRPQVNRQDTGKSLQELDEARRSRLIESIVRHASPPLRDIESRRQSKVASDPELSLLPLPNMGTVSGAPSPNLSTGDSNLSRTPPPPSVSPLLLAPLPPVSPLLDIDELAASVQEGTVHQQTNNSQYSGPPHNTDPAAVERSSLGATAPSPEPPLPAAGAGVIPTLVSPTTANVHDTNRFRDTNGTGRDRSHGDAKVVIKPHPKEMASDARARPQDPSEISPPLDGVVLEQRNLTVNRGNSSVSKDSRPDVSPVSEEDFDVKATPSPARGLAYGIRKPAWLDVSDDEQDISVSPSSPDASFATPVRPKGMADVSLSSPDASFATPVRPKGMEDASPSRPSTGGTWERVSRGEASDAEDFEQQHQGWHTPVENSKDFDLSAASMPDALLRPIENARRSHERTPSQPINAPDAYSPSSRKALPQQQLKLEENVPQNTLKAETPGKVLPPAPSAHLGPAGAVAPSPQHLQVANARLLRPGLPEERPMSFTPIPRDSSGDIPQEQIDVAQPESEQERQLAPPPVHPSPLRPPVPQQRDFSQERGPTGRRPIANGPVDSGFTTQRTSGPSQTTEESFRGQSFDRSYEGEVQPPIHGRGQEVNQFGLRNPPAVADHTAFRMGPQPDMGLSRLDDPSRNQTVQHRTSVSEVPQQTYLEPKKSRKSGLFGSRNRPGSASASSALTLDSTQAQASESPTRDLQLTPDQADVQRERSQALGKLTKSDKRASKKLERAQSSGDLDGAKKRRFSSLAGIFGRSGTTGHSSSPKSSSGTKKLQKINERSTPSPAPGSQQQQQQQDARPQPLSSNPIQNQQTYPLQSVVQNRQGLQQPVDAPLGGFYAPGNATTDSSRHPSDRDVSLRPPTYAYGQGQPTLPTLEPRSVDYVHIPRTSPPPHKWRPSPPQQDVADEGVLDRGLRMNRASTGSYGALNSNPPPSSEHPGMRGSYSQTMPTRHSSAPDFHQQIYGQPRPVHAPRMPSIGEDGRHQERPWALQMPEGTAGPDDDPSRRNSIQYAMMMRQQMQTEQDMLAHQPQNSTMPMPGGFQPQFTEGQFSDSFYRQQGFRRASVDSDTSSPELTIDHSALIRMRLEAQERAREEQRRQEHLEQQEEDDLQRAMEESLRMQHPAHRNGTPHHAYTTPASDVTQPAPSRFASAYGHSGYDQSDRMPYPGRRAVAPEAYPPLPTSPVEQPSSPVNPLAGSMQPPPLPPMDTRLLAGGAAPAARLPQRRADEEGENPVMRATSYPGMEWAPRWDD